MKFSTEPVQLEKTTFELFDKRKKQVFSLSGACDDTHSFLYFGIHGIAYKIELSDIDLEKLESVVKELRNARTKPKEERERCDRR